MIYESNQKMYFQTVSGEQIDITDNLKLVQKINDLEKRMMLFKTALETVVAESSWQVAQSLAKAALKCDE